MSTGLCRTSEIFGISEFVVGSIRHVKDPAFQSLSVTAHKWIPIREVQSKILTLYHSKLYITSQNLLNHAVLNVPLHTF